MKNSKIEIIYEVLDVEGCSAIKLINRYATPKINSERAISVFFSAAVTESTIFIKEHPKDCDCIALKLAKQLIAMEKYFSLEAINS